MTANTNERAQPGSDRPRWLIVQCAQNIRSFELPARAERCIVVGSASIADIPIASHAPIAFHLEREGEGVRLTAGYVNADLLLDGQPVRGPRLISEQGVIGVDGARLYVWVRDALPDALMGTASRFTPAPTDSQARRIVTAMDPGATTTELVGPFETSSLPRLATVVIPQCQNLRDAGEDRSNIPRNTSGGTQILEVVRPVIQPTAIIELKAPPAAVSPPATAPSVAVPPLAGAPPAAVSPVAVLPLAGAPPAAVSPPATAPSVAVPPLAGAPPAAVSPAAVSPPTAAPPAAVAPPAGAPPAIEPSAAVPPPAAAPFAAAPFAAAPPERGVQREAAAAGGSSPAQFGAARGAPLQPVKAVVAHAKGVATPQLTTAVDVPVPPPMGGARAANRPTTSRGRGRDAPIGQSTSAIAKLGILTRRYPVGVIGGAALSSLFIGIFFVGVAQILGGRGPARLPAPAAPVALAAASAVGSVAPDARAPARSTPQGASRAELAAATVLAGSAVPAGVAVPAAITAAPPQPPGSPAATAPNDAALSVAAGHLFAGRLPEAEQAYLELAARNPSEVSFQTIARLLARRNHPDCRPGRTTQSACPTVKP